MARKKPRKPRPKPYLWTILLPLGWIVTGCHGTDLRVGTGHTFADGGGSASASGKHHTSAAVDYDAEDTTSLWVEVGFQLTPQTVIVRNVDEHGLEPLYPPRSVVHEPTILPMVYAPPGAVPGSVLGCVEATEQRETLHPSHSDGAAAPPPEDIPESGDIDWEEVIVAVLIALVPLFFGGRAVVRRVKRKRSA